MIRGNISENVEEFGAKASLMVKITIFHINEKVSKLSATKTLLVFLAVPLADLKHSIRQQDSIESLTNLLKVNSIVTVAAIANDTATILI